jgi:hypothetical protein
VLGSNTASHVCTNCLHQKFESGVPHKRLYDPLENKNVPARIEISRVIRLLGMRSVILIRARKDVVAKNLYREHQSNGMFLYIIYVG